MFEQSASSPNLSQEPEARVLRAAGLRITRTSSMDAGVGFALSFRKSVGTLWPVNRLSKAILIVCVSLAAVALVAIVAVNLYLQSPGTQARIQEELRRGLRIPLRITSTSVTPWGGLRISG